MSLTRRAVLSALAVPVVAQEKPQAPAEWRRYADPSTEFDVYRLTNPAWESVLPPMPCRAIDHRGRTVLHASNRGGSWQAWVVEIPNGQIRQLGTLPDIDPASLTLSADDREAFLFSGAGLMAVQLGNARTRELCRAREGWKPFGGIAPTEDGTSMFFVERRDGAAELRRLRLPKGVPETVIEHAAGILGAFPNPRRATVLWRTAEGELWLAAYDGTGKRRVETPAGRVLNAHWAPDGQSFLYLLEAADKTQLNTIREQGLDTHADALVAKTSQFVTFSRNANATVFIGASRNKASPTVLLLLRATRREFTLCEHKASDVSRVSPVFTPNSQRIIFQSDRHGKSALYTMNVEKLIEKTDS